MGLGWMLSREAYLRLLAPLWPPDSFFDANPHHNASGQEWDDFVRKALLVHSSQRDAPLECAFPEVPRTRHTLDPGAAYSTSADTQARWFDQMRLAERTGMRLWLPSFIHSFIGHRRLAAGGSLRGALARDAL